MEKKVVPGLQCLAVSRQSCKEFFVTATPVEGESAEHIFEKVANVLRDTGAHPVAQDVFCGPTTGQDERQLLANAFGEVNWPVTWLSGKPTTPAGMAGTHIWAVSGLSVAPLELNGAVVGSLFEDDHAHYCRLSGVLPADPSAPPPEQTRDVFERMDATLRAADMTFDHVVRTWFFNDDILSWYDKFNKARDVFFRQHDVLSGKMPASTGMGGSNAVGAALVAGLFAVRPKSNGLRPIEVPSPLQRPALEYGSSFSRATELPAPDLNRIFVSGTASIDPDGATLHIGDTRAQVAQTMEIVNAILESRGMSWEDVTRAFVYFKHGGDAGHFQTYCTENGLPPLPAIFFINDVCRDDLLFEIEVDAILESGA